VSDNTQTPAIDLQTLTSRFAFVSKLFGQLHRFQILIRRCWWLVLLIGIGVMVPVSLYSLSSRPTYQSKARMWLVGKLDIPEDRMYTEQLVNYIGTQAELLRSPKVYGLAMADLDKEMPAPALEEAHGSGWREQLIAARERLMAWVGSLRSSEPSAPSEKRSRSFNVTVTESSKSSTLDIEVVGLEPKSTRAFLDHLMSAYLRYKRDMRGTTTDRAIVSLLEQVRSLHSDLEEHRAKLHTFQMSNNVVFLQEQGNNAGSYLASVSKQLAGLRTELKLLRSMKPDQWVELGSGLRNPEAGQGIGRDLVNNLTEFQNELTKASQQMQVLQARRDELAGALRPTHPKMLKLDQEIAAQRTLVDINTKEGAKQIENRLQAVELEIRIHEAVFQEWDSKAIDASRKMADYEQIRQDIVRTQTAHDRLLGLVQNADVSKGMDQENMAVLEAASPADARSTVIRNLALGAFLASGLSGLVLYVFGLVDDRFASLGELRSHFSLPVLGQVPDISLKRGKSVLGIGNLEEHRFDFLESFRSIRSALQFLGDEGARPKTLLITSSVPEDGKSTVTAYLAATMAIGGARVLLVDADMRRSTLHKYFNLPASPGLADVLSEEKSSAVAIVPTSVSNLWLLPAGEAEVNPGELVLGKNWKTLLESVYGDYDYILIDSPPILATDDAASLAPSVDGFLFVVRCSFTSARLVEEALGSLFHRKAKGLGLILNRTVASPYDQVHYHRYQDRYSWKSAKERPAKAPLIAAKNQSSLG
jgi:succinoglycan biosynthesis transport protein ExoP